MAPERATRAAVISAKSVTPAAAAPADFVAPTAAPARVAPAAPAPAPVVPPTAPVAQPPEWRVSVDPVPQSPPSQANASAPPQVIIKTVLVPMAPEEGPAARENQGLWLVILVLAIILVLAAVALEIVYLTPLVGHAGTGHTAGVIANLTST